MNQLNELTIYVRYWGGAYNTNRVGKLCASSTSGARAAAERLAAKVFGPALQTVEMQGQEQNLASMWLAKADADVLAWCWADGSIEFGSAVPEDALRIASGPDRTLRQLMPTLAPNLVVPGVAGSKSQADALVTVRLWVNKMAVENGNPKRCGVRFGVGELEPLRIEPDADWKDRCRQCTNLQVTGNSAWRCNVARRGRSRLMLFAFDARLDPAQCGPEARWFRAKGA